TSCGSGGPGRRSAAPPWTSDWREVAEHNSSRLNDPRGRGAWPGFNCGERRTNPTLRPTAIDRSTDLAVHRWFPPSPVCFSNPYGRLSRDGLDDRRRTAQRMAALRADAPRPLGRYAAHAGDYAGLAVSLGQGSAGPAASIRTGVRLLDHGAT